MKTFSSFQLARRFALALVMPLFVAAAYAIPAKPGLHRQLTLADGATVSAVLVGDEYGHFWQATDGKAYRAIGRSGKYQSIDKQAVLRHAKARRQVANQRRMRCLPRRQDASTTEALSDTKKGLVILVNYSDVSFQPSNSNALFKRIANDVHFSEGDFKGSVRDYFYDQSQGKFELVFDVVGPVTVSREQSYYGENGDDDEDKHAAEMVIEALRQAVPLVNYADYDWNGDGVVEQVYVVYAGKGEADGGEDYTIWPHEYALSHAQRAGDGEGAQTLDGVVIDTYACGGELNGQTGDIAGIGTMCHEFSHCLGYPDFYDTEHNSGQGMDDWDLMASGSYNGDGYQPAGYTSYERWMAGWEEPTELVYTKSVSGMKSLQEGGGSYVIYNKGCRNEFFLLENRQPTGWDASLPGKGLLILHVDYDEGAWRGNHVNVNPEHQRMTWIPADNEYQYATTPYGDRYLTLSGLANDPYPYGNNRAFGRSTTPAAKLYNKNADNTYYLDSSVEGITQNSNGTIAFRFKGETPPDNIPTSDETVYFDRQGYANGQSVESFSGNDFTVVFSKGKGSRSPAYYTTGMSMRLYSNNQMTVASANTITKIVLSYGPGDSSNAITTDVGTFDTDTWTGKAHSVTFTVEGSNGHRRIMGVTVTYYRDYYKTADDKTGAALKTAMGSIVYNRTEQSYDGLWTAFKTTDVRSDGKIWDMYSDITNYEPVTGGSTYAREGDCYNREHSFPNSWFGGESNTAPMYTDLHHVYPTDGFVNGKRGNHPFGETNGNSYKSANAFSKLGSCTYPGYNGTVFEPADEYKGDFARTYFYMVTCYEEQLASWYANYANSQAGLKATLNGTAYPAFTDWQLKMLMKWAKNDPVSEKETARNNEVYKIQNNRNPFIDYPGLEEYIWGTMKTTPFSYDNYEEPVYTPDVDDLPLGNVFELVTDATTLSAGDEILLVAFGKDNAPVALGTTQNTNNRSATGDVTLNGDGTLTPGTETQLIVLEKDGDNYLFNVGDGYLCAVSSSSNYLRTTTTGDDNAKATIAIGSDGLATITFQGTHTRNVVRYNPNNNNPLFSCYASTSTVGSLPKIYRKVPNIAVTISDVGYSTLFYSDKNLQIPEGVNVYTLHLLDNGTLQKKPVSGAIGKATAVVLEDALADFSTAHTYQFAVVNQGAAVEGNCLHGYDTAEATFVPGDTYKYYMLSLNAQNELSSVGFYFGNDDGAPFVSGAHKAFLALPASLGVKSFLFDGTTTTDDPSGLADTLRDKGDNRQPVYNLHGQRTDAQGRKGIYVVGGRKVVVK